MKKIAMGCDPNAAALKEAIKKHLTELGFEWEDYGSDDPIYANVAITVAEAVAAGKHDRGNPDVRHGNRHVPGRQQGRGGIRCSLLRPILHRPIHQKQQCEHHDHGSTGDGDRARKDPCDHLDEVDVHAWG